MSVPEYKSTRGGPPMSFEAAVRLGLAKDGGLLVPTFFPQVSTETLKTWSTLSFTELAFQVMRLYIPTSEVGSSELETIINNSYKTFRNQKVTPVVEIQNGFKVLELFHGPTFAFKDVALQFLGNLFEHFISQKENDSITVLGATSGDTGSSAIYGLRGKKGVKVYILYPEGRVSSIQEKQMITVLDENINCLAVKGTFDDAQAIVKALFRDSEFRDEVKLAAVNSINWARILAQIVYYFYSYFRSCSLDEKVSFSVPTGNFGDILAGYYAKRMGLPVDQMIVATNENDILHKFFTTGEYLRPAAVSPTISPSMDICVSSNFERFLFHNLPKNKSAESDNGDNMNALMTTFESTQKLVASPEFLKNCQDEMISARISQPQISETIGSIYSEHKYLLDPHSAIGVAAYKQLKQQNKLTQGTTVICLACAHWGKFASAVSAAIGEEKFNQLKFPEELEKLKELPVKKSVLEADKDVVKQFVLEHNKM